MPTLINGHAYDWNSLIVTINGIPIIGISEINYSDNLDMDFDYGNSLFPVGRMYGKFKVDASITISVGESTLFERSASSGLVQNLPSFNMQIIHSPSGQIPTVTVLHNVKLKGNSRGLSQNDMGPTVTYDLSVSHIERY